jgi:hypothetical protein
VFTQPVAGSQLSVVHGLLSSQFVAGRDVHPDWGRHAPGWQASPQVTGVPVHPPFVHWSPVVQALPPSQVVPFGSGALTHPLAGLQLSAVQALLSLQSIGVKTHPLVGSQLSAVQALPSLQLTAGPPQWPPVQVSPAPPAPVPVHLLLSSQAVPS